MNTTAVIGLLIIAIMFISTFSFAIIQSVKQPSTEIPKTNILDHQLDLNLKNTLVENGVTFMTLEYNSVCENCLDQKSFLELVIKELGHQVSQGKDYTIYDLYLEEIVDENASLPKLTIISNLGYKELTNATQEEIFSELCNLMTSPPITCVAR